MAPKIAQCVLWGKKARGQNGGDKVYLQECMVTHGVRGGSDKAVIVEVDKNKTNRSLDVLALGNSLGNGSVIGEVLAIADFAELERRKEEVKGKIVYYNNGFDPTNVKPFISYGQAGIYRRTGPRRAAKYGAIGVMIRSLKESNSNDTNTGVMQ